MRWSVQDFANKSDEELVALSRKGDPSAAEELFRRYKNTVKSVARKCSFAPLAETDDLAQEGMIGLYSAIGSYDAGAGKPFRSFVYPCILRRVYSYLRFVNRRKPEGERAEIDPESIPVSETPEDLLLLGESEGEFRLRLLKELSDFEFRVVMMYLEGMSYADISEETGRAVKSVDNALARAKRKLQKVFA